MSTRLKLYLTLFCFGFLSCGSDQTCKEWPAVSPEAKPYTRWWWMGSAVDKENLTYNLEELAKAGIGGVEITPIYGVKGKENSYLEYLSPQWMEMLAHTQSEAERLGMAVDMNMGTGWPFGGPDIEIIDAATRAIFQEYHLKGGEALKEPICVLDERQKEVAVLSKLMAYASDGRRLDLTSSVHADGSLSWIAPEDSDWHLVALFVGKTFQQVKRAAPGGQGLVLNHLDTGAVARYFNKFEKAFTETQTNYPHSFFNDSYEVYGADWTADLLIQFEKRKGYKLQDYFPEFLAKGDTDLSARVIADYREVIGEILQENFTNQWVAWAHERNISIRNQAHGSPANLLDLYASVDIPECESFGITGFDIPYLRKDSIRKENDGDPTTLKYASSAAHITGKKYTSAETFTWLTEHFRTSLSQCKPEIDQMFVSGVNHVYFHGSTYSPKDANWPGWKFYASVDMSPTNTIWRDAPAFFDYITRTQSFLQYGIPNNDFLLYLPVYDMWHEQWGSHFLTFAIHGMRERLPEFYQTVASIRENGYDVDYISDRFLQTTQVEHGTLVTEGGVKYKALILPTVKRIPLKTFARIKELAEQGAKIVFAGQYPMDVPGFYQLEERRGMLRELLTEFPPVDDFSDTDLHTMGKGAIITGTHYQELLEACHVKPEPFKTTFGGDYIRRKHTNGYHYFFTMLQNKPVNGWVPLAVRANSAMFFDPMTGKSGRAEIRKGLTSTEVYMQLKPGQSIILKTFSHKHVDAPEWEYYQETGNEWPLEIGWEMGFVESSPVIEEHFTLPALGSWTDLPHEALKKNKGTARYKTTFDIQKSPLSAYRLSLGDVRESARVYVNGKEVSTLFSVPFETDITQWLKDGRNILEIEVTNLPANRIADYDREGVDWRIFHEINFVSITYQDVRFDGWKPMPSGLLGPVVIKELKRMEF